jgi:TorA maturation chaperone TorD
MWNSKSYSADFVLWKVLKSRYGSGVARELVQYADHYGLMLEALQRLEMNYQPARQVKIAQQTITELDELLTHLSREPGPHHKLIGELQALNTVLHKQLNAHTIAPDVKK